MAITIEAVYENGVLKPVGPLPLNEHEAVRVTIEAPGNWVEKTCGICGWKGSVEDADYLAADHELDYPPLQEKS